MASNTEFWWFDFFSNFTMFMFLGLMVVYFIIKVIKKISKKENIYKVLFREVIIIDFGFWTITRIISSKISGIAQYKIVTIACIITYVFVYLGYYILNEKRIKEIGKK